MTNKNEVSAGFSCPCCGYLTRTYEEYGTHDICVVCGWQDDHIQFEDPNYRGGANESSLNEARECYKKHGCSELRSKPWCRPPLPDEIPPGVTPLSQWSLVEAEKAAAPQPNQENLSDEELKNILPLDGKKKKQ